MGYQRGEEVFRDQPFSYVVKLECRSTVCDFCLQKCKSGKSLKNCSGCKIVYYCNPSCQKNSWSSHHQVECAYLKKAPPIVLKSEDLLLMIRIILKLQKGKGRERYYELPDGRKRYFSDLVSHRKDIESNPESMESFQGFYLLLNAALIGTWPMFSMCTQS